MFLVAAELAGSSPAAVFAGGSEPVRLTRPDLRPARPVEGRLFEALAAAARSAAAAGPEEERVPLPASSPAAVSTGPVRLLVPAVWLADGPAPDVFGVADHVNLRLRGALTGRWPAGAPRVFPDLSTVYEREPPPRRPSPGARVYSGLTVAGVGDVRALTAFEIRAINQLSLPAASDSLVDAVIVAAYYGLSVAAWCVPLPT